MDGDPSVTANKGSISEEISTVLATLSALRLPTIAEFRARVVALVPSFAKLEQAPRKFILPARVQPKPFDPATLPRQMTFAMNLSSHPDPRPFDSDERLSYATWLSDGTRQYFRVIVAQVIATDADRYVALTREGEKCIDALLRQAAAIKNVYGNEIKDEISKTLLEHFRALAVEQRKKKEFPTFANFQELESFLRLQCGYLYCMGNIFVWDLYPLKHHHQRVLCFSESEQRRHIIVLAQRNPHDMRVELTEAGKACLRFIDGQYIRGDMYENLLRGTTMRRAVINSVMRGHNMQKVSREQANEQIVSYATLDEAEVWLRTLSALRYIPWERKENCLCIKRNKRKKIVKLFAAYEGRYVETSELAVLLSGLRSIYQGQVELRVLAEMEANIPSSPLGTWVNARKKIERQRQTILEKIIAIIQPIEAANQPRAKRSTPGPRQQSLNLQIPTSLKL